MSPRRRPAEAAPSDAGLDRRRFLERMTALTATAIARPGALAAATSASPPAAPPRLPSERLPPASEVQAADPTELTLAEAASLIRARELSPVELVRACLDRIQALDGTYLAFNTVLGERALDEAREREGGGGTLDGIPFAVKDNFLTAGTPTTANSLIFRDFVPDYDATAWARLRAAGAILLGKTQMGPLATTAATTPSGERTTVNAWAPHDPEVSPGGSSSGSATAVAARLSPCSTGTQTGGSITNPSNAQGLTGLKPTMGRVSLHGIIPLTYTRDHVGPLARDARDAAIALQVMAGPDPADPRSLGLPPTPDLLEAATAVERAGRPALRWPTRIGVPPGYLDEPAAQEEEEQPGDPGDERAERREAARRRGAEAVRARRRMLDTFESLGAEVVEIGLPEEWETLTSWQFNNVRLPERSEIFLEHLRGDVRRFGVSLSPWINGLLLPAAEYVRGQRARLLLLRRILDDLFARCDVVVQTAPFPFDMVGLPLIAFPIGFETASAGVPRPIGALLGGLPYGEDRLLSLAGAFQAVTGYHRRRPRDPAELEPREGARGGGGGREGRRRLDLFDVMRDGE